MFIDDHFLPFDGILAALVDASVVLAPAETVIETSFHKIQERNFQNLKLINCLRIANIHILSVSCSTFYKR